MAWKEGLLEDGAETKGMMALKTSWAQKCMSRGNAEGASISGGL